MKRMSAWAITHPVFPLVMFAVLSVFGIVAFIRLPITLNPDISAPFVQVTISEPGAAPAELETQILQKVEGAVANIGNVKNITSTATEGVGTDVDRISDSYARGSRHHRRARCRSSRARRSAPGNPRAASAALGRGRRADRVLRHQHHGDE